MAVISNEMAKVLDEHECVLGRQCLRCSGDKKKLISQIVEAVPHPCYSGNLDGWKRRKVMSDLSAALQHIPTERLCGGFRGFFLEQAIAATSWY